MEHIPLPPPVSGAVAFSAPSAAGQRGLQRSARAFREALTNAGLLPGDALPGGRMVRCPVAGDKPGRKSGWFVYYDGALPAGAFGDWRSGLSETWCAKSETVMSVAEAEAYRQTMIRARQAREAERARLAADAAERARRDWERAVPAVTHPYLERKGVHSFGLRLLGGKLLMPVQDMIGALHGLQIISANGEKRFSFGCEKKGKHFIISGNHAHFRFLLSGSNGINDPNGQKQSNLKNIYINPNGSNQTAGPTGTDADTVAVCEGYATAASIHMATGWTVLVAFDCGNLSAVAAAWRDLHPLGRLVICGDDDALTPGNPGRAAAEAAAKAAAKSATKTSFILNQKALNRTEDTQADTEPQTQHDTTQHNAAQDGQSETGPVTVMLPVFGANRGEATDFNDLHALSGLDEVRRQLKQTSCRIRLQDWLVGSDYLRTPPAPQRWLIADTFTMASVNLLAAMGGAGKSLLALDLALKVASKQHKTLNTDHMDHNDVRQKALNIDPIGRLSNSRPHGFSTLGGTPGDTQGDTPGGMLGDTLGNAWGDHAFGNTVVTHGPVAMFTAEDNKADIHRRIWRLAAREPAHPLALIPLPSAGGPMPFVLPGGREGPQPSPWWHEIKAQLIAMRPALVIFDPLAAFALVDLNKPEVADFTMSLFASLADETGACVLVTHHLAKTRDNVATPEQARTLVRGSTAIVDRTRATYVLWSVGESRSREICDALHEPWAREKVYQGCVAKENSGGDKSIKTYVRGQSGLLRVRDHDLIATKSGHQVLLEHALIRAVAEAAEGGQPFTRTGANGLMERKSELPSELHRLGRPSLLAAVDKLLLEGSLVMCVPIGGTTKNRLDVPTGPIAGAAKRIQPGSVDSLGDSLGDGLGERMSPTARGRERAS